MKCVTCKAPVNIAVIKYWGKRDEHLILPINDSISATLSMEHMHAKTTIMASADFKQSKFWLNGVEQHFDNERLLNCLNEIRRIGGDCNQDMLKWHLHICSENNFPTAAGLASSAAGYACLVYALAKIFGVTCELSAIARRGSGSACRSIYGGWVQWHKGSLKDGTDSIASEIRDELHWPEMRILVLVVNDTRKKYSSTSGMNQSVKTSELLKHRSETIVPQRVEAMRAAIVARNFAEFAELTMKDSNQFHAVCLDTYPPCVYMNDVSHAIVNMVHAYNDLKEEVKVAYTFDAGPNACLYLLESDVPEVIALINEYFPTDLEPLEYLRGIPATLQSLPENIKLGLKLQKQKSNSLKYIIYTQVGEGAKLMEESSEHLLNEAGYPKKLIV